MRHLVHRVLYALLIPCSSLFGCPLDVSCLSCATLSPFGISFLPLWSLALWCHLFSVPSPKLLLMTSLLMALPQYLSFGIILLYCKLQCKIMFLSFFLSFSFLSFILFSLCLLRRVPWLAPMHSYWTIQIVSILLCRRRSIFDWSVLKGPSKLHAKSRVAFRGFKTHPGSWSRLSKAIMKYFFICEAATKLVLSRGTSLMVTPSTFVISAIMQAQGAPQSHQSSIEREIDASVNFEQLPFGRFLFD